MMQKYKDLSGKKLFLIMFSLAFLLISSAAYAGEIREVWNNISLNDVSVKSMDSRVKEIWNEFERSSVQRGMLIKPNYQPFVPIVNRIIVLDTPAAEIAFRKYSLHVETEVIDGQDTRITALTLSRISEDSFPEATKEQQVGYVNGKLGENTTYWIEQKKIIPEELKALEQLKLENFERSIELDYTGDTDYRKVPIEDVLHFFPEISNDLKLNFGYLYPQNDTPMLKTTYEPGKIHFGSLFNSDIRVSFLHNIITGKMVHGEISWKVSFGEFTTGEEIGLSQSFFDFMQETLAKSNLIAPASISPF